MRPTPARADYLIFAATPTVHGDSDDTIGETTETLEDLIASYEAMAPDLNLHVGPLTLGPRFNPNATTPEGLVSATGELTFAAQVLQWLSAARGGRLRTVKWPLQARVRGLLRGAGETPKLWIARCYAGAQKIALPSERWRISNTAAEAPPRLDAGTLAVEGFCAVELSRE
jgi:hypothetical protein